MDPFDLAFTDPRHPAHAEPMAHALAEARLAAEEDEVPVGCVVYVPGRGVIAAAHNQREQLQDPTAHAEMIALTQAAAALGSWRLDGAMLYVTLEPCPMCAAAISAARVGRLYYGAADPKSGGVAVGARVFSHPQCHHVPEVYDGIGAGEAEALLKGFFAGKRG